MLYSVHAHVHKNKNDNNSIYHRQAPPMYKPCCPSLLPCIRVCVHIAAWIRTYVSISPDSLGSMLWALSIYLAGHIAVNISSMYMNIWCRHCLRNESRPQSSHGIYTKPASNLALYHTQEPSLMMDTRLSVQLQFTLSHYTACRGGAALTTSWSSL